MNEMQAFIAKVCEEPDEDTHRMVFADWLDENGEPERAEFIRVQCRLECMRRGDEAGTTALEDRERELLLAHGARWFEESVAPLFAPSGCASWAHEEDGFPRTMVLHGLSAVQHRPFRRGFIENWTFQTEQFLSHAAAVFASHPVTAVTLTTKSPGHHQGGTGDRAGYWWEPGFNHATPRRVPFEIGEAGERAGVWRVGWHGGLMVYVPPNGKPRDKGFATPELALAALSGACVAHGRFAARVKVPS